MKNLSFLDRLIYLGGNLGIRPKIKPYVDLEEFIVDSTINLNNDSRTRETVLNWIYLFTPYFSPSKLRRILKVKDYNKKILGQIVDLLESHPLNSQNWLIVRKLADKSGDLKFNPNPGKYLKDTDFILKNCVELRNRVSGMSQVSADLKSYLKKNKKYKSLYQIAKETFNPKNRVNFEYRLLNYLSV